MVILCVFGGGGRTNSLFAFFPRLTTQREQRHCFIHKCPCDTWYMNEEWSLMPILTTGFGFGNIRVIKGLQQFSCGSPSAYLQVKCAEHNFWFWKYVVREEMLTVKTLYSLPLTNTWGISVCSNGVLKSLPALSSFCGIAIGSVTWHEDRGDLWCVPVPPRQQWPMSPSEGPFPCRITACQGG